MAIDTRVRQFDPNFALPEELQFAEYAEETPIVLVEDEDLPSGDDDFSDDNSVLLESEVSEALDVPTIYSIVSQTVRTSPDGRTVVDVVINVEDVYDAVKYDVRVTKT